MPLFPLAPIFSLIGLTGVAIVNAGDPDEGRPGLIATGAVMLLSAIYYWFVLRRRTGGWLLIAPVADERHGA